MPLPVHLVTPDDWIQVVASVRKPKHITITDDGQNVVVEITPTRWQNWFVNKSRWRQQVRREIAKRKPMWLQSVGIYFTARR